MLLDVPELRGSTQPNRRILATGKSEATRNHVVVHSLRLLAETRLKDMAPKAKVAESGLRDIRSFFGGRGIGASQASLIGSSSLDLKTPRKVCKHLIRRTDALWMVPSRLLGVGIRRQKARCHW